MSGSSSLQELDKLKPIIRSLIMSHRNQSISLMELEKDFKEIEGFAIPYQKLGFSNLLHLLRSMPDIVQVSLRNGYPEVTYVTTQAVEHVEHLIQRSKKGRNMHVRFACPPHRYDPPATVPRMKPVTGRYRSEMGRTPPLVSSAKNYSAYVPRIEPFTTRHHSGVDHTSPPVSYATKDPPAIVSKIEPVTTRHHSETDHTSNTPLAFVLNIEPVTVLHQSQKDQIASSVSAAKKARETLPVMKGGNERMKNNLSTENQQPAPKKAGHENMEETCEHVGRMMGWKPSIDMWDVVNMMDLSPDVVHLSQTIPKANISSYFYEGEEIEVRIQHILNPNRIWLRSLAQDSVMKQLAEELHECYDKMQSDDWCMEPGKVQHGLYCAARIDNRWYRARIVGPLIGKLVKLFFIDTGLVENVNYKHVKFLFKTFSNFPAQAIRASMACLIPNSNAWTRVESDRLATLIASYGENCLTAYTIAINQKLGVVDIILIDQQRNERINETFASAVNARWTGACYMSQSCDVYREKRPYFNEKRPSFFCIEEGHFPSLEELRRAKSRFFDFEELYTRLPHFGKNGVVEKVSRETNEAMIKQYGIVSVTDAEEMELDRTSRKAHLSAI